MEPVAWIDPKELEDGFVSTSVNKNKMFDTDVPLYAAPQKYCPTEDNAAYEKGYVEGMSTQIESQVHRAVENLASKDVERYQWLRAEFYAGRETYIGESMLSGEALDLYIDRQLEKKCQYEKK
jgi:hypothetical protein